MACRWISPFVVLLACACACGPSVGLDDTSGGSGSGSTAADDGAPMSACAPPADAVRARLVLGRGTPTFEIHTDESDDPQPFACLATTPSCGYHVHRLVPLGDLVEGSYSVAAGTLSHEVESCWCCNGEGGGPDETRETVPFPSGQLELQVNEGSCIVGRFLSYGDTWIPFVAEICAR